MEVVSDRYIPPFSWVSSDRDIRFELIYKAFNEIFNNPEKYPFPDDNFELYVDGFYKKGENVHTRILSKNCNQFVVTSSDFTVELPEADQSIFSILNSLDFSSCLIKYRDNDILLSALINWKRICSEKQVYLKNLGNPQKIYNVSKLYKNIADDPNLHHLSYPVESLVYSFLIIGNNDYSGRIYGMSCDVAYRALHNLEIDLVYNVDASNHSSPHAYIDHWPFLVASGCDFSLSNIAFKEFIKLLYIEKNLSLFKNVLQLPLPENIQKWKKSDLISVYKFLGVSVTNKQGKQLTIPNLKQNLINHLGKSGGDKEKLASYKTEGKKLNELDYSFVKHIVWLNKDPKFWPPSENQIDNMFGRLVLTIMLFSIPSSFPPKSDLCKFGYLQTDVLKFNLLPTVGKEKSVRLLLASVLRKSKQSQSTKRKNSTERSKTTSKKQKRALTVNLID